MSVSGADFFRGLSLGTERKSGASVERGVEGALDGPLWAQDGRGVALMEMAGGNVPSFLLVASCVARSYSLTSSIVMSFKKRQKKESYTRHKDFFFLRKVLENEVIKAGISVILSDQ